jgi:glucan 1,3-beta-glucosidase
MRRLISTLVLAICAVFGWLAWWHLGQPVAVADASRERVNCVSYAPFAGDESPLDGTFMASPERIAQDMERLSQLTECVRTYGTANGLDQVPAAAEKAGLQVMQGIWIGRADADNEREIARGIALAQAYPQTIRAVVVGNEALLRREITAERLSVLIDRVKGQVSQPVTYADVWEFWHQNSSLAAHVDFVTLHLLPYWEDQPAAIDQALAHISDTYRQMEAVFPHKPLLIGEIGWPSIGRQRQGAEASKVNETRFIRQVVTIAAEHGWQYNLIEAFDQPWKRALEGTTGGYWGLFDQDRSQKVTLQGPVVELETWQDWALGAVALTLLLAAVTLVPARKQTDALGLALMVTGAAAAANGLAFLARYLLLSARNPSEEGVALAVFALMVGTALVLLRALPQAQPSAVLGLVRRLCLAAAAVAMLGHLFDARYRDFPSSMFLIPAVGFALLRWQAKGDALPRAKEETPLAALVLGGAVYVMADEGWQNDDALAWGLTLALFALASLPWPLWSAKTLRRGLP